MSANACLSNGAQTQPLSSIIIVTYNSEKTIKSCIDSVLKFSLAAEIIVVDNGSSDSTRTILTGYGNQITSILKTENIGFSRGCNTGILASCGKYVVLLNPDTVVTPGWLEIMLAHFKPGVGGVGPLSNYVAGLQKMEFHVPGDFPRQIDVLELAEFLGRANRGKSVETKLLIGFCLALPRQILDEIGLLDPDLFLGNDDLEISWRLRLRGYRLLVATDAFVYHHGQVSFKSEPDSKTNQLVQDSTDKLYAKLVRHYGDGNVPSPEELWGINWFKPTTVSSSARSASNGIALITIIILTLNQLDHTRLCLESIQKNTPLPYELIIVDNGSNDGTLDYLRQYMCEHSNVRVIANDFNLGFAMGNNQAIPLAKGDFIVLLNNDTVAPEGWLERMRSVFERYPRTGIVGPMSNSVSGPQLIDGVGYGSIREMREFASKWSADHAGETMQCGRIVGFCLMMRKKVVERIGGLDTRFGSGNFEDDDLCIRATIAGFELRIAKDAFVHHSGGRTFRGQNIDFRRSMLRNWSLFKEKWGLPPGAPLGRYAIDFRKVPTSGIYIQLPDVAADHFPDADMRWWQEASLPGMATREANSGKREEHSKTESNKRPKAQKPIYLNVGCGNQKLDGFINIDNTPGADLQADAKDGLPFAGSTIGGIYNEHFIEHLTQAQGAAFLRECRRVLVPGGILRIATPDLDLTVKGYLNDNWRQREWITRYGYQWIDNRCEMLNIAMREWGHKWVYNEEELSRLASLAGFSRIRRCRLGESDDPTLRGREHRRDSGLILELTKLPLRTGQEGLVSILIPSYNSRFFGAALESALQQTYQNFEIIICDDNRSEDISNIVSRHAASDKRIKYIKNPEQLGERENRLKCFGLANGEYIKFLNDDDLLHRDCLSRMVSCLESHPDVVLITSHRQLIDENGVFLRDIPSTQRPVSKDSIINGPSLAGAALALTLNFIGEPTTTLFRKCDLETTCPDILCFGGRQVKLNGDMAMWLTLLSKGDAIYLTDSLSYFRIHSQQAWQQQGAERKGREAWEQHRFDGSRFGLWNPHQPLNWIVEPLPERPCEAGRPVGVETVKAAALA